MPESDQYRAWANTGSAIMLLDSSIETRADLVIAPDLTVPMALEADIAFAANISLSSATVIQVPNTVDATGATDVTTSIQFLLDTTPDGATLQWQPGAIYRCDKTLWITAAKNFTVDLNGGEVRQVKVAPYGPATTVATSSNNTSVQSTSLTVASIPAGTPPTGTIIALDTFGTGTVSQATYSGISGTTLTGMNSNYNTDTGTYKTGSRVVWPTGPSGAPNHMTDTQRDSANAVWTIDRSTNVTITNGTWTGSSHQGGTADTAYLSELEECHGIKAIASNGVTVSHCTIQNLFGDYAYLQWDAANPNVSKKVCGNVLFDTCTFQNNGRVAISPMAVIGLEVKNCTFVNSRRSFYDFEPPTQTCTLQNLHAHGNTYGTARLLFMSGSGGGGNNVSGNIWFDGETSSEPLNIQYFDTAWKFVGGACVRSGPRRGPFKMTNCVATRQFGSSLPSAGCVDLRGVDGITISGNTQPIQVRSSNPVFVNAQNCTSVSVGGNNIAPASPTLESHIWDC